MQILTFLLLMALFSSFKAQALTWAEVETASLISVQEIRHSSGQEFSSGTWFEFKGLLVGESFLSFQFQALQCRNAEIVSDEIDLVIPPGGNDKTAVGLQVGKDCLLQVFVETMDLQTQSFFGDRK